MKYVWCLSVLPLLCTACIPVTCGQLDRFNCAAYNTTVITVNSFGCSGMTCTLRDLVEWLDSEDAGVLHCMPVPYYNYFGTATTSRCPERPLSQNPANGDVYPIRCESSSDCEIQDGSQTPCICGLDGFQYCKPLLGSQVFESLWATCEENDDRAIDSSTWEYYEILQQLYVYQVSAPSCAQALLEELVYLQAFGYACVFSLGVVLFL